jgi:uncharacterized membrane protein YgcG
MRCPACQQETHENAAECACGFSLAALDKALGIPPTLKANVTDMVNELTAGEIRRITAETERLERRFPQMNFAVVACSPPEGTTLALYLFWLFNRGGLGSAVERGGMSRMVMLGIDPYAGLAACMIGYGLEPLVSEARITAALNAAFPAFARDSTGDGVEAFLAEMERQLAEVASTVPQSFGLSEIEFESTGQVEELEEASVGAY